MLTYKNDALEQYSRRESIRINDIQQANVERPNVTEDKVIQILKKTGVDVKREDITACHRVGKHKDDGTRPVIVKFISRKTRTAIMRSKKLIKDQHPKVFINDDLTSLRSRLFGYVKHLHTIDNAWTIDGRIFCRKKLPPGMPQDTTRALVIESPDDLFNLLHVPPPAPHFLAL